MKRKFLVLTICITMIASFMPLFAAEADAASAGGLHINYTALGDQSTQGLGMSRSAGYGVLTKGTFPAQICDLLAAKGFTVTAKQLGRNGMRVEELRYLLDDSYPGDAYRMDNFAGIESQKKEYTDGIQNADLITYGLGSEDFGSFVFYLAEDVDNRCTDTGIIELVAADPENIKQSLRDAMNAEVSKIDSRIRDAANVDQMIADFSEKYIEAGAYVYYSFCRSYDETIRLIRELNPDCGLIVLSIRNPLGKLQIKAMGATFDLGGLVGTQVTDKANAYMSSSGAISGFVDTESTATFKDEIKAYDGEPTTLSQQFRDYCDVYEDDFLLASAVGKLDGYSKHNADEKTEIKNIAYDAAGECMRDIAGLESLPINNPAAQMKTLSEDTTVLAGKGAALMAGIKGKALEFAGDKAKRTGYQFNTYKYQAKLKTFAENSQYGSSKDEQDIGRIVMALGMRTSMGDGFFRMPSAAGHKQIADSVLSACNGVAIHVPAAAPTCTVNGNDEVWADFGSGQICTDEAMTKTAPASAVHKATGHAYGAQKVVVKPAFCKDGKAQKTCSKCGNVVQITLEGTGPAPVKISKLAKGKKSFTAKWKKPSSSKLKKMTGYELRYSTSKSMKGAKTVKVSKKSKSKTVKKLKAKKKYYVQLRTYKTSGGKKYYSAWSKAKSVKTK